MVSVCHNILNKHVCCRLHVLLAGEAALRDCSGDAYAQDKAEEGRMAAALRSSFHAMDREVLQRARGEEEQDGATAVVILRTGGAIIICVSAPRCT